LHPLALLVLSHHDILKRLRKTGSDLVALDKLDNVGVLDSYFFDMLIWIFRSVKNVAVNQLKPVHPREIIRGKGKRI
jgi:hypothetical protein